jgi:hypothetical protein
MLTLADVNALGDEGVAPDVSKVVGTDLEEEKRDSGSTFCRCPC